MKKKKSKEKSKYGAKSIQVLQGLEPVRKRPGMYIGGTSLEGLHHLVWEVVNNSVDEAMAGYCKNIIVKLLPENKVEVFDDGRGIPVEKHPQTKKSTLETVMTMLHAGGKFGGEGYKVSGGLHGVGVSVVNALSIWTKAEVYRDGKIWVQEYKRGKSLSKVKSKGKSRITGTVIAFQPDPEVFPEIEFSWNKILDYLRQQAYLTKGVKIILEDWREIKIPLNSPLEKGEMKEDLYKVRRQGFYFDGGIVSFVKFLNRGKAVKNEMPVYVEKNVNNVQVEISLQYTDGFKEHLFSFANNINTVEGGMHVTGFKSALTRVLNDYGRKNNFLKDKSENFTSDDVREGLTAIVSVKLKNPQFEGQTKSKLGNSEVRGIVGSVTSEGLQEFLENHPRNAKAILEKCFLTTRARIAARAAKDAVLRKGMLEGMTLPGKLADCTTRDPDLSELYIVEGDSAGGCFSGETRVALADGRTISFKNLVKEHQEGKKNYCYTINNNGEIAVALIKNPRITKRKTGVIKVILDNNEEIVCTADHKFMLKDGNYKKAEELIVKDSLMPLYHQYSKIGQRITIEGYEMVLNPQSHRWIFTHMLSDEYNLKNGAYNKERGDHKHHIDFNKLNNNPGNIIRLTKEEHMNLHSRFCENNLKRPEVLEKLRKLRSTKEFREKISKIMKSPKTSKILSKNAKKQWGNREYKEFMKNKFLEFFNSNSKYRKINNDLLNKAQKEYWSNKENRKKQSLRVEKYFSDNPDKRKELSEISEKQWRDNELLLWRSEETKKQWTKKFRKKRKVACNKTYLNKALRLMRLIYDKHKILSEDLYNKERKRLNDKSIIKISTIRDRFFAGDERKLEKAVINFNHKIKAVEKVSERMDVFDLEVPETHNFALAAGVFVHNSAKQGRDRQFQAVLPLRGKLVNVEKTSLDKVVKSDTLKPIMIALGTGIGESFNPKKLRYGKIIIMADADVDGSHIRTLLLTFFYRYFEELITEGHVYIAQPPLYRIQKGKEIRYAYNENEKEKIISEMDKSERKAKQNIPRESALSPYQSAPISIQRYKGLGEMNPEQLWETTMNPESRMMLQVKIENAEEADRIFDVLMGNEVEPRKRYIQAHAKSVKNLDI